MPGTVLKADSVVKALHGSFCRDVTRQELLQTAATKIHESGHPYAGVYIYLVGGDALELAASAGPATDRTSIPTGTALKSDLVVLIRRHEAILGEIAIESDVPEAFSELEEDAVRRVADALASLL